MLVLAGVDSLLRDSGLACVILRSSSMMDGCDSFVLSAPLICESPFVACGGCTVPAVSGLQCPLGWAGPTVCSRVANSRGAEHQGPRGLSRPWFGRLRRPFQAVCTDWVVGKNDKCLLRASYEWPDHKPQDWTRAALLCLGPDPKFFEVSVKS